MTWRGSDQTLLPDAKLRNESAEARIVPAEFSSFRGNAQHWTRNPGANMALLAPGLRIALRASGMTKLV
jgi:hypothetical protein